MEHIIRLDWQQMNLVQLGSLQAVPRSHEALFQVLYKATRPESWWTLMLHLCSLSLLGTG